MLLTFAVAMMPLLVLQEGAATRPLAAPRAELFESVRIGRLEGGPDALSRISDAVMDSSGRIFIGQPQSGEVRAFEADGSHLWTSGKSGLGPGEFSGMGRMGVAGDKVWVTDFSLVRITTLEASSGSLAETSGYVMSRSPFHGWRGPIFLLADGNTLALPNMASHDLADGRVNGFPWIRVARDGATIDTVLYQSRRGVYERMDASQLPLQIPVARQPFHSAPLVVVDRTGESYFVVERGPEHGSFVDLSRLALNGDTLASVSLEVENIEVRRSDVSAYIDDQVEAFEKAGMATTGVRSTYERWIKVPSRMPPVVQLVGGLAGWGAVRLAKRSEESMSRWVIFGPDLTLAYEVLLPADAVLRSVSRGSLLTQELGPFDIPQVVVYSVSR